MFVFKTLKCHRKNKSKVPADKRVICTFGDGVYDITDYIDQHPGGRQILLADGKRLEPFWKMSPVHYTPECLALLETMRIGDVPKKEEVVGKDNKAIDLDDDPDDPFTNDPERSAALKPIVSKPYNGEVPAHLLAENFITPNEFYFIRNHLPVPDLGQEDYKIKVEVEGTNKSLTLTLDEIKKFPKHTITAAMMCAGFRRDEMNSLKEIISMNWSKGALGNAVWAGARLKDVLAKVGITEEDDERLKHVQFESVDLDLTGKPFGASIPLWRAVSKRQDVILAYEMNGGPLSRDHGFPLRIYAPGGAGARNVKWLSKIIVSHEESQCHYYQKDYKGFAQSINHGNVDYSTAPAVQELPINSAIGNLENGDTVKVEDGFLLVKGYAYVGGGREIIRVDLTADQAKTWFIANLEKIPAESGRHWAWTLWNYRVPIAPGTEKVELWVKAMDSSYNSQPETFEKIWNFRGVHCNAYHRITVNIK